MGPQLAGELAQRNTTTPAMTIRKRNDGRQPVLDGRGLDALILNWKTSWSIVSLVVITLLCLLPFTGKAFHIDDPLFIWAAQHIQKHPLDPYGFKVLWYTTEMPMFEVTKNPPLASYYCAMIGSIAGWSEKTLHLAFLLPAVAVILGTYYLSRRFTNSPLLAAAATLLTPGFLVSAGTVMCDVLMLAFWIFAVILWIEGLEPVKPLYLAAAGLLIAAAALTKYFGISLIPLLLVYSHARLRSFRNWVWFLLFPVFILAGYQFWTKLLYGRGLILDAVAYARAVGSPAETSILAKGLVGVGFAGGCMLPGLTFASLCWSRKGILGGIVLAALAATAIGPGWWNSGATVPYDRFGHVNLHLALFIVGGMSILALALRDLWKRNDPDALFLAAWVIGTLYFACCLNWTINARSVLPLIPAAGILLARHLESTPVVSKNRRRMRLILPLLVSGSVSLWVAWADMDLANSARSAAMQILGTTRKESGFFWFQGHWGFQYYMELLGARPLDEQKIKFQANDVLVIPENNTSYFELKPQWGSPKKGVRMGKDTYLATMREELAADCEVVQIEMHTYLATMRQELGAGYYASLWGPLPFAFGPVPAERYHLLRLTKPYQGLP